MRTPLPFLLRAVVLVVVAVSSVAMVGRFDPGSAAAAAGVAASPGHVSACVGSGRADPSGERAGRAPLTPCLASPQAAIADPSSKATVAGAELLLVRVTSVTLPDDPGRAAVTPGRPTASRAVAGGSESRAPPAARSASR